MAMQKKMKVKSNVKNIDGSRSASDKMKRTATPRTAMNRTSTPRSDMAMNKTATPRVAMNKTSTPLEHNVDSMKKRYNETAAKFNEKQRYLK